MDELRRELSLTVGDSVQIGDYILTLVDLDGEVTGFRVDPVTVAAWPESAGDISFDNTVAVSRAPR